TGDRGGPALRRGGFERDLRRVGPAAGGRDEPREKRRRGEDSTDSDACGHWQNGIGPSKQAPAQPTVPLLPGDAARWTCRTTRLSRFWTLARRRRSSSPA